MQASLLMTPMCKESTTKTQSQHKTVSEKSTYEQDIARLKSNERRLYSKIATDKWVITNGSPQKPLVQVD